MIEEISTFSAVRKTNFNGNSLEIIAIKAVKNGRE
jgi:hypothetical protein